MLGIDQRSLKIAWTLLLFGLLIALVYTVRHTLVIFVLAIFLAQLLYPLVALVERFTPPRVPRAASLALVYVVLLGIVTAIIIPIGSALTEDAATLAGKLPGAVNIEDPLSQIPLPSWMDPLRDRIEIALRARLNELGQNVFPFLGKAVEQVLAGAGSLASAILIPILAFFFIKDGAAIREEIKASFPEERQATVAEILDDLQLLLSEYIRALVILSASTFVAYLVFLAIAQVPYAILLAGIAAALEFIPAIGPLVGAITVLVVAVASGYPHWLVIILFLAVYRIFQDYLLNPALMSSGVKIHPLLVLFGVLAGAQVAGIPGIFFSAPLIAGLRVTFVRLRRSTVAVTRT